MTKEDALISTKRLRKNSISKNSVLNGANCFVDDASQNYKDQFQPIYKTFTIATDDTETVLGKSKRLS